MWNFDDPAAFSRVLRLVVPWARNWADMRPGRTDRERREELRALAIQKLRRRPDKAKWWAFRISVQKSGNRPFDIENVPKTIIDSFSVRQLARDRSRHPAAGLYPDDSMSYVQLLQVYGHRGPRDATTIEIFAYIG